MEVLVGIGMIAAGLVLRALAGLELERVGFPLHEALFVQRPPRIAQNGIYRYLRHPAYVGSFLIIAGAGLAALGWGGAVILVAAWPFFSARIKEENRILKEVRRNA